jgi:chlorite dismutase
MNAPADATQNKSHSVDERERTVDVWERTKGFTGPAEAINQRLFMQLLVFDADASLGAAASLEALGQKLVYHGVRAVVYEDVNNPHGFGLLSFTEDPTDFVTKVRPCFAGSPCLRLHPSLTMIGRTYATGYEPDLEYWLLRRPAETVMNLAWPWAVWYPLRRSGAFARLDGREQGSILKEHGEIGKAYGAQDLAHDVRLACHGLDARDNEFVIGLIGKELHPLSHVVQAMRKTRQTSEFIEQMGPFFVGHAVLRTGG